MEVLYQEIANFLNQLIPEEWEKIYLYAELSEEAERIYFYYYPNDKTCPIYSLDIPKISTMDRSEFRQLRSELGNMFRALQKEFKNNNQEPWTNLTLFLDKNGKFNIKYDYTNLSEQDSIEQHIVWKYNHLGLRTNGYDEILDKHISSLNKKK